MKKQNNITLYWWQKDTEDFFSGTPSAEKWFRYIECLFILGTLEFLTKITNNFLLKTLYFISLMVIWNTLNKFFYKFQIQKYLPSSLSEKKKKVITYSLALISIIIMYFLIAQLVLQLSNIRQSNF
ncbi:MAG: hypothetical protein A2804_03545 [Candidatus Pacebacteria bacterium RIFCSPHIGHO2_01_FULL_46_10]|nr:MAG: hypothetical protein A2804_03545 [Candidatus Pacebacteria bacterium RIFCSPHIGHO2_01_FULL_46_10]